MIVRESVSMGNSSITVYSLYMLHVPVSEILINQSINPCDSDMSLSQLVGLISSL